MCISNGPARFSSTKGYIGRTKRNTVVMAYQMEAQVIGDGLRAIILQIPTKKVIKIHNTTEYCNFLNDIYGQSKGLQFDPYNGVTVSPLSIMRGKNKSLAPVLEVVGMYNVAVLKTYKDFNYVKEIFPADKCPEISPELIEFYSKYYSDWSFVVATFDNKIPMSAQPFMVEYESKIHNGDNTLALIFDEVYIFPALDNGDHNGHHKDIPKIGTMHYEDHFLTFPHEKGLLANYSQRVPEDLISNKVGFYNRNRYTENGDFLVYANGNEPIKINAASVGTIGLDEILTSPKDQYPSNAFINW